MVIRNNKPDSSTVNLTLVYMNYFMFFSAKKRSLSSFTKIVYACLSFQMHSKVVEDMALRNASTEYRTCGQWEA